MNSHRIVKLKYRCDICERTYTCLTSLSRHKKIHEGSYRHACHLCSKKFIYLSALQTHLKTNHP